ncbi:IclR family transcriptional regulator [Undibacterium sp.]|uniref:IclR family transcriptional regulator n=1 Tax=Undibacterium sp. TaxID=1914977 RepID=UPI0025F33696|nr:IclR family transcriptional regulator [Undibacterium sp.]
MSTNDQALAAHASEIPTNERVLQVLACIARHGRAMSAKDLAAQTQLPLSTIYRHLIPLKKWGWVQEHAHSGAYEPGPLAVQLAWGFDQHSYLMEKAHAEIAQLVAKSGESVGLMVYLNGQVICLAMQDSAQALRCSFAKGRANSSVRGASAKALLAYLPAHLQHSLLAQQSDDSELNTLELMQQLELIRQQRYAVSENEIDQGVWGVSAPVFSEHAKLEASLSLMAPASRAQPRQQELIQMTLAAADRLSQQLSIHE